MNRIVFATAMSALAIVASPTGAREASAPVTVASYPNGTFLENLSVDPRGRLIFTSYFNQTLLSWNGRGSPTPLVKLDVHPVAVLARSNDIIVSAHGKSFADGPAFTATNQVLVLTRAGAVKARIAAPGALFLNGMVEVAPDRILVADSIAGKIWGFDPASGQIESWLADPLLAADPATPSQRPGANGLKLRDGWLYVSNSARGAIYRIRLSGGKPAGSLELFATTGPVDDFTFLADGAIAAATHGDKLIRIGKDGAVSDIL